MIEILKKQYVLLQGSRGVVLNFIETEVGADLTTQVPTFDGSTMRYLLVHTVNCYMQWLGYFALKMPLAFLDDKNFTTLSLIRPLYSQVDDIMGVFLENFAEQLENPLASTLPRNRQFTATPLQLFTHVLTHEFHHKGQIMTMCRLLGHTPPDTDIIRT
jgi:uncharacterized damage-inducible protein DinB